uniref:DNA polymerase epsilon subunit B N-terminal domain-containing protein n=1 Tax=Periophthalmus magnuspinnatus TaxID=409849 RepID=A0A3B3ZDY2_9GOBI
MSKNVTSFTLRSQTHRYVLTPDSHSPQLFLQSSEASRYLVEVLESVDMSELDDVIERVLDAVEKQPLLSSMIELSVLESAVQDCTQSCNEAM